jgi:hypothetical protein
MYTLYLAPRADLLEIAEGTTTIARTTHARSHLRVARLDIVTLPQRFETIAVLALQLQ